MKKLKTNIIIFSIILLISVLAGFFIYPRGFGANVAPWRLGLDLVGGSALVYDVDLSGIPQTDQADAVTGLKDVIEKRVNLFGVSEPKVTIARKGDKYQLLIELAGIKDLEEAQKQIGETPILDFREVSINKDGSTKYVRTELTGRFITAATMGFDNLNKPVVSLEFNNEGAKLFGEITGRNIGKPLAVFLDGKLFTAPTVQGKITGGKAQISGGSGGFSFDEAKTLIGRFNAGALSAPIKLINQRTVSPSAAGDALDSIVFAGIVGTILVMLFMIIYYRFFGIFAAVALIIYTLLSLALFKLIPNFTMTLSGIAGFVLSIGMAVDANILIFERTKEELKLGKHREDAINEGFKRAWSSIRDSNLSTIITAIILYFFTSSFVKGFALTLGLGVGVSMFSAIFITRTMLRIFMRD